MIRGIGNPASCAATNKLPSMVPAIRPYSRRRSFLTILALNFPAASRSAMTIRSTSTLMVSASSVVSFLASGAAVKRTFTSWPGRKRRKLNTLRSATIASCDSSPWVPARDNALPNVPPFLICTDLVKLGGGSKRGSMSGSNASLGASVDRHSAGISSRLMTISTSSRCS